MQKEFSHLLRAAYIQALAGLTYQGAIIPVSSEYTVTEPGEFVIGNRKVKAYCILKNQTENDDSLKCAFNSNASIQLHIICKYPAGSGSELQCEEISNLILQTLFPRPNVTTLEMDGFKIWRAKKEGGRTLIDEPKDYRIFTKILIFSHSIQQLSEFGPAPENVSFPYSFDFSLS